MEYLNKTRREVIFGQAARDVIVGFEFGHQGDKLLSANGEKWAFWLFLRNFKVTRGHNVWLTVLRSRGCHPGECLSTCQRHLTTAGVCDPHLGGSLRHLPTAGVCDQHFPQIFPHHRHMLTGKCRRHWPTKGACNHHLCVLFTHCPTAIV